VQSKCTVALRLYDTFLLEVKSLELVNPEILIGGLSHFVCQDYTILDMIQGVKTI